ncbi:MAG: gluconate 2-dehydrogenase subunit 3 family protein [Flavobacteriaceae bacterium]|jgi:hypothetical protein
MNRRDLLKKASLGFGTLTLTPLTITLFQSCKNDHDWNPYFFNSNDINLLIELSDIILPSSKEIPGAKELELFKFVDIYTYKVLNEHQKQILNETFTFFKSEYSNNFKNSNASPLNNLLKYYLIENKNKHDIWMNNFMKTKDSNIYIFLNSFRELLINAFKTNEYIGKNVLVYRPVPGEQKGCVDLQKTTKGKAWTI